MVKKGNPISLNMVLKPMTLLHWAMYSISSSIIPTKIVKVQDIKKVGKLHWRLNGKIYFDINDFTNNLSYHLSTKIKILKKCLPNRVHEELYKFIHYTFFQLFVYYKLLKIFNLYYISTNTVSDNMENKIFLVSLAWYLKEHSYAVRNIFGEYNFHKSSGTMMHHLSEVSSYWKQIPEQVFNS